MQRWMLCLVLVLPGAALADYPDDVQLTSLAEWDGVEVTDTALTADAYHGVVRQLGAAIANKPMLPAETLGAAGMDASLSNAASFIHAYHKGEPASWQRVQEDGDPTRVLWIPSLQVRKGLPLSLEAGASLGYIAFSRQTAFGGYGRWALIEGYRSFAPDLAVQVGYTGYIGNDELELGVLDMSTTVSYTIPFGVLEGINQGAITPYISAGMLKMRAEPRLSEEDQASLGVAPLSGWKSSDDYVEGFSPFQGAVGMQLRSTDVVARTGITWVPGATADKARTDGEPPGLVTVSFSIGMEY